MMRRMKLTSTAVINIIALMIRTAPLRVTLATQQLHFPINILITTIITTQTARFTIIHTQSRTKLLAYPLSP